MNIRTAVVVDMKREAYKDELRAVLDAATQEEAGESEAERPAAPQRFKAIGERIIALADEREHTGDSVRNEEHSAMIELGVNGLAIALKARQGRVDASFMPWQLSEVEAQWIKDGDVEFPLSTQKVSMEEVNYDVVPQVHGMLNLMERSLDTAELARSGLLPLAPSA